MENKDEEIELLDFEADEQVSNQIDEMLDFIDLSETSDVLNNDKEELNILLENSSNEENKLEIDASKEQLDDYVPSIKDFNIKSAKTRKIVKKAMLYVIIVMLLGFEFFITKTGDILNDLKVYASDNQPIRIVQNNKYGYIDYTGNKIVNPKYSYGEEFINGYAIVKDSSNLPLIIDKGGKEVVPTGNYFSIYRVGEDIIASKVTKKGLKYGILDANLKEKASFVYDMISFEEDVYTYTKGNIVGLINKEGKEIYEYKLTDEMNKVINVKTSKVTNEDYQRYAVITVNSSSQIININDGSIVSGATLNEIVPEENNVFYELKENGNKTYIYVQDNKVVLESDNYSSLRIDSITSGVLKALTTSYTYEFISTKTGEQVKNKIDESKTYYGDNVFVYLEHNYKKNKDFFTFVKNGEIYKTIEANFEIEKSFKNGIAVIKYADNTYGYLNEEGTIISDEHFIEANEFDSYKEAICKTLNGYGVINSEGKVIIDFENADIKMASGNLKKKTFTNSNNIFYAIKKDNKYALYNNKGKRVNKTFYNDVSFDENYALLKVSTDYNDLILTTKNLSEINLTSYNTNYNAFENYIIIKNEYYNYSGKLIYVDNTLESGD